MNNFMSAISILYPRPTEAATADPLTVCYAGTCQVFVTNKNLNKCNKFKCPCCAEMTSFSFSFTVQSLFID